MRLPGPDAHLRDALVPEEADEGRDRNGEDVGDRLRVDDAQHRLVGGVDGAEEDHEDDGDAGEVLDAAEAVGVALRRRAPRQREGDPERARR